VLPRAAVNVPLTLGSRRFRYNGTYFKNRAGIAAEKMNR
jgi:hypothetical protein